MPVMKAQPAAWGVVIALLVSGAAVVGHAASFSAELVNTERGETRTGAFQFHENSYRYEVVAGGETLVITKDGASGRMRLLQPALRQYLEAGPDEPMSRLADPFGCYAYYARTAEVHAEGTEPINGVPCTKQVVSSNGQVYVVAWFSEELGFPLRVEIPLFEHTVELRRIQRGPQEATLFALPAGYTAAPPVEEFRQPDWAGAVVAAPIVSPPFERTLEAVNIVRIRPQAGRHVRLEVSNTRAEPCTFTAVSFKGGRALSDPRHETVTLDTDQTVFMTLTKGPDQADDLVLRTSAGTAQIKASLLVPGDTTSGSAMTPEPPKPEAELEAPDAVDVASRFEVMWSGPGANEDYITVARPNQPPNGYVSMTRIREGNPVKVWAPSDPGDYEVRYILGRGTRLMGQRPITVLAVTAALQASGPVKAASWIEVAWVGPAADGDYICVARPDQAPGANLGLTRVKDGTPLRVRAPSEPGEYEVRYLLGRGNKLLARAPVTIEPVTAAIEVAATASAGADFEVRWTGPGYPEDYVSIARPNQPPTGNLGTRPTRLGNPVKFKAPKEPGLYEVRYILGRGHRLLARATITIAAP